jgi:hypothetical protein
MQIDERDEQFANTNFPTLVAILEPDSNVTVSSETQSEKHFSQSFSTDDGMQIEASEQQP